MAEDTVGCGLEGKLVSVGHWYVVSVGGDSKGLTWWWLRLHSCRRVSTPSVLSASSLRSLVAVVMS